jgi:hypothetical protein
MKVFGSISRLVSILFRKDSQDITVRPNQATTYTAARDIQLPPGDAAHILVSADSAATFTNKTFDADGTGNSISNIENADIKSGAAIDATKIHDGSVTNTEFGYIGGLTSDAQTQLNAKVAKAGDTMTGSLLIDNANELRLGELDTNGSAYVALKAPDDLAGGTYTLTLPPDDGAANQVLQTDGSGVLSWVDQAGIASFAADWVTADGTTKAITHNLGTKDIQVELYDKTDDQTIWVDTVIRTSTNVVTLTSSEAPGASGWRVTIHASGN